MKKRKLEEKKLEELTEKKLEKFFQEMFPKMTVESFEGSMGVTCYVFILILKLTSIPIFDLMVTLFFLKNYPTNCAFHWIFGLEESTCRKKVANTIEKLDKKLPKLNLDYRLKHQQMNSELFEEIFLVVDGTEQPIERPSDDDIQRQYYSGKKKCHTIKFQILVSIVCGLIVDFTCGYVGSTHDASIYKVWLAENNFKLLPTETILGDKGYQGCFRVFSPNKYPEDKVDKEINSKINKVRVIVENSIGRLKKFRAVREEWRHDLSFITPVFSVCCKLANLDIIDRPLRRDMFE